MMITPAEEENNVEVRREDQTNINKFARLNARLHELRDERKVIKVSLVDSMRDVLWIIFRIEIVFICIRFTHSLLIVLNWFVTYSNASGTNEIHCSNRWNDSTMPRRN